MVALIKLIGMLVVALGVMFLLRADAIKLYLDFWTKGKRTYTGAVLSLIIGIIFLLGASQCRLTWIIALVGIWAIIKGVVLFVLGPERLKSKIDWWKERAIGVLRVAAFLCLTIGALIIYAA